MNKILIKVCLFLIIIQFSNRLLSQTVFDYSTFSTSQCNAFNPSVIINGSTHSTTCGTVQYDNIGHGITLDNNVISSFNYGTEFKLSFNFKQSYSYTIKVKADAVIGTPSDPWPRLRIDVSSASNGSGAFCNGPESINTTSSLNYYNNQQISPGQFVDYTFNIPSLSTAMSFLYVGSFPQLNGSSSTIEINKITITEIPPSVSFTLPASTTFACGTTTPQTFTITNVYNTTGITNYTWNLGSASNNWLYNGGPAPQTISTGTTGSISLTPVCGAVQTNVFAT